jgi:hypothetical protein
MFARDRTSGLDEQPVAWRATISARDERTGAWRVVRQSDAARAVASDDLATYFNGDGWLTGFPLGRATYTATVEMLWYDPAATDRVEGNASHAVEHYMVVLRYGNDVSNGKTSSVCSAPR